MTQAEIDFARLTGATFADMLTLALGLAVRTHPQEVKKALEAALDLSPLTHIADLALRRAQEAMRLLQEVRDEFEDTKRRLAAVTNLLEVIESDLYPNAVLPIGGGTTRRSKAT